MIINPVSTASATEQVQTFGQQNLDKMDFLRLLVSQVQHQDPLNPMSNDEFVAQLTQFSILEQNQNVNDQLSALGEIAAVQQAAAMVGQDVSFVHNDGSVADGHVDAVHFTENGTYLEIGGERISPSQVTAVRQGSDLNTQSLVQ